MTFIGYVIGMILAGFFYAFCSYIGISMYYRKVKRKQEQQINDYMEELKANMKKEAEKDVQSSGKSGTID